MSVKHMLWILIRSAWVMSTHSICFHGENEENYPGIIFKYSSLTNLLNTRNCRLGAFWYFPIFPHTVIVCLVSNSPTPHDIFTKIYVMVLSNSGVARRNYLYVHSGNTLKKNNAFKIGATLKGKNLLPPILSF